MSPKCLIADDEPRRAEHATRNCVVQRGAVVFFWPVLGRVMPILGRLRLVPDSLEKIVSRIIQFSSGK